MIPANHQRFYVWFFRLYARWMLHQHFRSVHIKSPRRDIPSPVLLIGNHFSWWDGFIVEYINNKVFRKKLFIMMLEEQLKGRLFLSKAGAFSIRKASRSALDSINYAIDLLEDHNNLLVIYPQGEIRSMHIRRQEFQKGVEKVLDRQEGNVKVFFYAALTDYFSHRKPGLNIYLEEFRRRQPGSLEDEYNKFLDRCILEQKED